MSARAEIIDLSSRRTRKAAETLVAHFSTHGVGRSESWVAYSMYELADRRLRCVKLRGDKESDPGASEEQVVDDISGARAYFGGGWVVRELFFDLKHRRDKALGLPSAYKGPQNLS